MKTDLLDPSREPSDAALLELMQSVSETVRARRLAADQRLLETLKEQLASVVREHGLDKREAVQSA